MKITIGSEGKGCWGKIVIDFLLGKLYQNIDIKYDNTDDCDFIILSFFIYHEPLWNKQNKKYICFSGEPRNINIFPTTNYSKRLYLTTAYNLMNNHLYIPYVLYSPHLYKNRKYENSDRKYLLAYCNSNKINEREQIFNLFVEKTNNTCHSFGSCHGKYPDTKQNRIDGGWGGDQLIDTYKDYKFVIAMENVCMDGYVTEKILNAFYSGAIPIYWGSSNVTDFFNKKAFINVNDFKTFEECVDYVIGMDDQMIREMVDEPIYVQNNELINLMNDLIPNNETLNIYLNKLKDFIEN